MRFWSGWPRGVPINRLDKVFADPQVIALGVVERHVSPGSGTIPLTRFPARLSATPTRIGATPPGLGQDNVAVPTGLLDMPPEEVARLVAASVLVAEDGMEQADTIVIGAGVVGLAVARQLALAGQEVLILDRAATFGTETSSRNSEVIHAGLYYPPGSLRARLCIAGRDLLYAYLEERALPHRRCGKLIVASDAGQMERLHQIRAGAEASGAGQLARLDRVGALALEPALDCYAALYSPLTGILDSHALMLSLLGDAEAAGAVLVPNTAASALTPGPEGIEVATVSDGQPFLLRAKRVVNSAGLGAVALANATAGLAPQHVPQAHFARGTWFAVPGRAVFSHLVYPVPEPGGLGIHLTLDLGGGMRFGPDVEWVDGVEYRLSAERAPLFARAIRRYWPGLPEEALAPVNCGIRPKIHGPGEAQPDFRIDGPGQHGIPGLVNLFGIESPGLTSCLAIAAEVAGRLAPP